MEEKGLVRVRRSQGDWQEIIGRQATSGMTVRQFCEREGISSGGFYHWRRRLLGSASARFVELSSELYAGGRPRAEVDLGQGIVFRIF